MIAAGEDRPPGQALDREQDMKQNQPSPAMTGTIEVAHDEDGVFIGGDPTGLRSLARLLLWLADVDQGIEPMPDGERVHVHLHPGSRGDGFASLTEWSAETEVCRLDAKGSGRLRPGPFRAGKE